MRDDSTQLRFCRALVDEWARHGVRYAFVSPGSRSTPMTVALEMDPNIDIRVCIDERTTAFSGLGAALASGLPSVLLCTSGSAATHFFGAVVEANAASVPLIVCTADRPPELTGVGAPQAMDQVNLFGPHVRKFFNPGVPDIQAAFSWRSLGSQISAQAISSSGPIHVNLQFKEPFLPEDLSTARPPASAENNKPWHDVAQLSTNASPDTETLNYLGSQLAGKKGLIIAGQSDENPQELVELAESLNWPLLASPQANINPQKCIARFDQILRSSIWAASHSPEVVVRFGTLPASKSLTHLLSRFGGTQVICGAAGWSNPTHSKSIVLNDAGWAKALVSQQIEPTGSAWRETWQTASDAAEAIIAEELAATDYLSGPEIARQVSELVDKDTSLLLASSMPVRDYEWFANSKAGTTFANRGVNGIDGLISTASGIAATGRKTMLVLGDVAFMHDFNALFELIDSNLDLTILVVDNGGGQIFSHLPQASQMERAGFEKLFLTHREVDLAALCQALEINTKRWSEGSLSNVVGDLTGVKVVVAQSADDSELYATVTQKVSEALAPS